MIVKRSVFVGLLLAGALSFLVSLPVSASSVVFDEGHGERFVISRDGLLDLSSLAAVVREGGEDVASLQTPLTDAALAGADALVISGPFVPLSAEEVSTVVRFLDRGGRLAVMLHIGIPAGELLHRLGVDFSNAVIHEQHDTIDADPANFRVTRFASHPLLSGVKRFSLYGVWALMATGDNARVITATSPDAWVDLDGDGTLSAGDAVQSFGVVVAGTSGRGEFLVFGDDAIFQNKFLDVDNRTLAANLAAWLAGGTARRGSGESSRRALLAP
jgi:hypothetical protein